MKPLRLLAACLVLLMAPVTFGAIVLVGADRFVEASYDYVGAPANSSDKANFALHDLTALSHVSEVLTPGGTPRVHSRAQQDSTITPTSIVGYASALVDAGVGPGNVAAAGSQSSLTLTFDVMAPIDFLLEYELSATFDTEADASAIGSSSISLTGPGGVVHAAELSNIAGAISGPISASPSGTLQPGQYTLTLDASQQLNVSAPSFLGSGQSAFDVTLTLIPEPSASLLLCVLLAAATHRRR